VIIFQALEAILPLHILIFQLPFKDSKCFIRPQEFIPERWTTKPELVLNPSAISPFGTGLHSCVGKALALDSMRFLVSKILKKYSFRFAEGDRGDCMDEQMKDQFVSNPGSLRLVFSVHYKEKRQDN
jgi:cytochrome P450